MSQTTRQGLCYLFALYLYVSNIHVCYSSSDDLIRRYWNDDDDACIRRNCRASKDYTQCLRTHCPDSVVKSVGRDLSDVMRNMPPASLTSQSLLSAASDCVSLNCMNRDGQRLGECIKDCFSSSSTGGGFQPTKSRDLQGMLGLTKMLNQICQLRVCQDAVDERSYERCFQERCLGAVMLPEEDEEDHILKSMDSKRRINDPVSQCIQSYCGDKDFDTKTRRMLCIVTKCHRPTG